MGSGGATGGMISSPILPRVSPRRGFERRPPDACDGGSALAGGLGGTGQRFNPCGTARALSVLRAAGRA